LFKTIVQSLCHGEICAKLSAYVENRSYLGGVAIILNGGRYKKRARWTSSPKY